MTTLLRYYFLYALALIMFYLGGMVTASHSAENAPVLTNVEEYAVFAAVLFPRGPNLTVRTTKAAPGQKTYSDTHHIRLDGITGNNYSLSCFTIGRTKTDKDSDQEMIMDYNHRNGQVYRLDEERLIPFIPDGGKVILVDPGEARILESGILPAIETTYISRPGFNQDLTKALVQINHVAGPEMGVGYQVYLEKSSSTGEWMIIDFDLNRRY